MLIMYVTGTASRPVWLEQNEGKGRAVDGVERRGWGGEDPGGAFQ